VKAPALRATLLRQEALQLERIAEDMERYALKYDGLRRSLASDEERTAPLRALQMLSGHKNVNAAAKVRDVLLSLAALLAQLAGSEERNDRDCDNHAGNDPQHHDQASGLGLQRATPCLRVRACCKPLR